MRDTNESMRSIGKLITERMAQPAKDAKAEEEIEQPEKDLIESEEETLAVEQTEEVEGEQEDSESDDEESESEEEEEETLDIVWNGETLTIPKTEAISLAQKGYDYSQKMQKIPSEVEAKVKQISEEKHAELEKQRTGLLETTELLEKFIDQPGVTQEQLQSLLDEGDTEGYLRAQEQEKQRTALIGSLKAEREKVKKEQQADAQKRFDEYSKQQAEVLLTKVPELKDEKNREALVTYAKSVGYSDEELKNAADARALEVLNKARKWDEMTSKGVKPKPKSKNPKSTKKTSSNIPKSAQQNKTVKDRQDQFYKSGSMRDFGKLYTAKRATKKG